MLTSSFPLVPPLCPLIGGRGGRGCPALSRSASPWESAARLSEMHPSRSHTLPFGPWKRLFCRSHYFWIGGEKKSLVAPLPLPPVPAHSPQRVEGPPPGCGGDGAWGALWLERLRLGAWGARCSQRVGTRWRLQGEHRGLVRSALGLSP